MNSSLKYLTNSITACFRERLTPRTTPPVTSSIQDAVLRFGDLDNADQRVVDDLHQFCTSLSDLFRERSAVVGRHPEHAAHVRDDAVPGLVIHVL